MIKLKSKGFTKALTLAMVGLTTIASVFSGTAINSSAHNTYFIAVTIDESNFRYVPTIVFEENDWVANNHRESDIGDFSTKTVTGSDSVVSEFTVPTIRYFDIPGGASKMTDAEVKTEYEKLIAKGDGDKGLVFSFPGLHSRGWAVEKRHANGNDEEMANFVAENLLGGLNDTLSWMTGIAGGNKKFNSYELRAFAVDLANKGNLAVRGKGDQTITLGTKSFTIKKVTDPKKIQPIEGKTTTDDYISITNGTDEKVALYKINKGYQDRADIPKGYKDGLKTYKDPQYINWQYAVLQANYSADVNHITFSSVTEIIKPGAFELAISSLLGNLLGMLRSLLGLYPMEEIFLNTGTRNLSYYYGVMPKGWMSSASLLNFVSQIIAWTIMGFAFVRMLFKRQLSTMNIGERVSLMEGLKDIFITCFLLAGFGLVFHTMIRLNYALVDVFSASSEFSSYIGSTDKMTGGVLATILINFAFFFINCYFNVVYVLRAFTVAMLYGIAPLAIVTIAFGGRYKAIFSNYMKELIANVFLQTFHAMCVAFFTSVTSTTSMRTFELLTVLCAFIPLTNFIRQNIVGLPGGITDQAQGIVGMGKSIVGGTVGGFVGSKMANKGKGGSGGGGGGGSNNTNIKNDRIANGINKENSGGKPLSDGTGIAGKIDRMNGNHSNSEIKGSGGVSKYGFTDGHNKLDTGGFSKRIASTDLKSNAGNIAKGLAGTAGNLGMAMASAGTAMGFGAIGDKRMMEQSLKSMGERAGSARSSLSSISSSDLKNAGAKDLYKDHDSSTMVMDDRDGVFNNSDLNGSQYEANLKEMSDCFNCTGVYAKDDGNGNEGGKYKQREDALRYYKQQGINGVGKTEQGNTAINFSNKMYGRKGFKFTDVGNIAMYDSNKQ